MANIPQYLSNFQLQQLIKAMPTPMMKDAATVMYYYGLRISELCNLHRSHVHLEHDVIRITGKGKTRDLPITEETREIIIRAMNRPGKLFNVEMRTFRNYIYLAASRADLGKVHPHMIRHSTATHLRNLDWELDDIKAWMRHENISSTSIYTHVAVDRLRKVGNSLSPGFNRQIDVKRVSAAQAV